MKQAQQNRAHQRKCSHKRLHKITLQMGILYNHDLDLKVSSYCSKCWDQGSFQSSPQEAISFITKCLSYRTLKWCTHSRVTTFSVRVGIHKYEKKHLAERTFGSSLKYAGFLATPSQKPLALIPPQHGEQKLLLLAILLLWFSFHTSAERKETYHNSVLITETQY